MTRRREGGDPDLDDETPLNDRFVRALVALLAPLVLSDLQASQAASPTEKPAIDTGGTTW
jgi:hypothetical protein